MLRILLVVLACDKVKYVKAVLIQETGETYEDKIQIWTPYILWASLNIFVKLKVPL